MVWKSLAVLSIAVGLPLALLVANQIYGSYYGGMADCSKLPGFYEREACQIELARKLSGG